MTSTDKTSLILYRGPAAPGHFAWSPFSNKLESRLRLGGVSYTAASGNPKSAPRGKIPYIELGSAREKLGDSTLIIQRLAHDGLTPDLNAGLTPVQRAQDLAIRALLEDRVYFYQVRERWCDNYAAMKNGVLAAVPWPLRWLVGWLAWSATKRTLQGQGALRYSGEEVAALRDEVWGSLSALLAEAKQTSRSLGIAADAPFWVLGRATPSEADATIFGFISSSQVCTAAPATKQLLEGYPVLLEYAQRIQARYFPDYKALA